MSEGSMTDPAPTPDRAAMMQALEALCLDAGGEEQIRIEADAIVALRAALALPAPAEPAEPVALQSVKPLCWVSVNKQGDVTHHSNARTTWATIPLVQKRQLDIAMRNWDMWKAQAIDLNERLQKYEPGSPMHLNNAAQPPQPVQAPTQPLTDEQRDEVCKQAREGAEAGWPYGPNYVTLVINGVERAHGIGAAPDAPAPAPAQAQGGREP
jgi:hypothetical protein